ncbi:hypothetical protein Tco_1144525 [Tanacetum coccineum]
MVCTPIPTKRATPHLPPLQQHPPPPHRHTSYPQYQNGPSPNTTACTKQISRKRLLLTAPTPRFEVGESSAAAAARQPGSTMARRVDHSFVDIMDTRVRDTERRTMAAVEVVNLRVSYQADVHRRESLEFYSRHQEAQDKRAAVRAEIEIFRREGLAYKQESIETRQALARSEAYSRALEARIRVLETQAYHHEWQRQDADDRAIEHIMRTQALEAGARIDTLEDTASKGSRTMATVNQGISVEEIKQIVAQRVANDIEAIAIYESINQTKQHENKVAGNASNKRKWESDHNGSSNQQHKGHKVFWAHAVGPNNKKYVGTLQEGLPGAEESTMETKLEVRKHVEWCMPLEEEKPNKTLTTLRMRSKLKRESCLALPSKP